MFSQVGQNREREQGGLGIGLSLVRRFVEMHGGSVTATSAGSGQGSTFTVYLPVVGMGSTETAPAEKSLERLTVLNGDGLKVLVVDDNVDAATMLAMILEVEGHIARVANDGLCGLEAAKEFRPDVIFLDIGMPGMNGYETAEAIRKTPGLEGSIDSFDGMGSGD